MPAVTQPRESALPCFQLGGWIPTFCTPGPAPRRAAGPGLWCREKDSSHTAGQNCVFQADSLDSGLNLGAWLIWEPHLLPRKAPSPRSQGDVFRLVLPSDQMNSLQELCVLQKLLLHLRNSCPSQVQVLPALTSPCSLENWSCLQMQGPGDYF